MGKSNFAGPAAQARRGASWAASWALPQPTPMGCVFPSTMHLRGLSSWAGSGAAGLHQEQKARRGVKHPKGAGARVPESCQAVASAHQALLCEGEALELWRRGPRGPPAWAPRPWRPDMGGDCRPRLRPGPGERSGNPMPLMDLCASLWAGNLRLRWKQGLLLNHFVKPSRIPRGPSNSSVSLTSQRHLGS